MYDFLTVAVTTSLDSRTKAIDDMIFRIYRDIMANYDSADDKLKIAYPKIIVDVVAILAKGGDTTGKKIPLRNIEDYYLMRKSDVIIGTSPSVVASFFKVPVNATTSATAASIKSTERGGKREELILNKDEESELVKVLNKITNRNKKDIQASIAKLDRRDIERIKDLCKNYNKLEKYSKLITLDGDQKKFKTALQNETGRKLSSYQLHMRQTQ